MVTYEELKAELLVIARIVEKLPETVQQKAYELLISSYLKGDIPATKEPKTRRKSKTPPKDTRTGSRKRSAGKESYKLDPNLSLRGDTKNPSFRKFVEQKAPGNAFEFNVVAVYYLREVLELECVGLEQLYTCYSDAKRKPPGHFRQSFIDTKNKKAWIGLTEENELTVTHIGKGYVDHDLPKPTQSERRK